MKKFLRFVSLLLIITTLFSSTALAQSNTDTFSTTKALLEKILEQNYYYKLEGNESGFVIHISEEGIANACVSLMYGLNDRESWNSYVNSTIDYANSISDFLITCGIENPNLLFIVLDDLKFNSTILAIYNGNVIYDFTYTTLPVQ